MGLEPSTSRFVVRHIIHWASELIDVTNKCFLCNTKQREVIGTAIYKTLRQPEVCHGRIEYLDHQKVYVLKFSSDQADY